MTCLYQALSQRVDGWRAANCPCDDFPATREILEVALEDGESVQLRYLRRAQLRALQTYWYLRLVQIDLLVRVARSHQGFVALPAPMAVLTGPVPGALEFNLRAWTTHEADWVAVRSEWAVKIRDAQTEAGREVPIPQPEISLRGVSPSTAASLAATAPSPAAGPA